MKRIYLIVIGLVFVFSVDALAKKGGNGNGNGGNTNTYSTVADYQGDFEDSNAWQNDNVPSDFLNIDKEMIINGTVTRNGNINPVTVVVNGTFVVDGNYENNQDGGLEIKSGATCEIFGDLNASQAVTIANGGTLIVHGNLTSTNAGLHIKGDLIVTGDFSTDSKTQVNNSGNLVVGGDFSHLGGGLNAHSDDIYILDPDATITSPGWGIIENGDYGDLDDFLEYEQGSDLEDIAINIGLITPVFKWVGDVSSDWFDALNWKDQQLPDIDSSVKIGSDKIAPVINGDESIANLAIAEGASVVVKPGASLEITGDVKNSGLLVLESEAANLASLMLPETMTNKGLVKVKLNLEADGRWYLSSPVKNTKLERFYPDNDPDNDFVYVFRNETGRWRWHRVDGSYIQNNEFLKKMENISANYKKEKTIEYTGEVYNQDVENDYPGTGYYLVGNPFPTAIDWNNAEGWNREGFSNTMWSWITIGEERVIMTYKTNDDGLPSVGALMPKGYDADNMSHIPPYQSFWVKKESADNSKLVVKREARIKKSSAPLKSSSAKTNSDNFDLLRVHADNAFTRDGAVLYFHEQFTEGEGKEDSRKRFNNSKNVPELFTRVDNQALSINGLPSLNEDSYHMPLSVRNRVEGEVKLSFDLNKFSDAYDVYLEDKKNGNWMNVRVINEYAYLPAKQGEDDRFVIHIQKAKEVSTTIDNSQWDNNNTSDINIDGFAQYVQVGISNALIQAAGNATIDVLDINGRLIQRQETNNTENEITLHGENGVYMVRVNVGGIVKTEKVIKAE